MGSFFIIFFARGLGFRDLRSLQGLALGDLGFTGQCFFRFLVFFVLSNREGVLGLRNPLCVLFLCCPFSFRV